MMPASTSVLAVNSFDSTRPLRDMAPIVSVSGQLQARGHRAGLDEAMDLTRAARVEVDVALSHGWLGEQQPGREQGLPHLDRERAVVAGEAARQMREFG